MTTRRRPPAGRSPSRPARRRRSGFRLPPLHVSAEIGRSLFAISLLVLGAVTLIALLLPGRGALTDWWINTVAPWFGTGRWLLPVLLLLAGVYVERSRGVRPRLAGQAPRRSDLLRRQPGALDLRPGSLGRPDRDRPRRHAAKAGHRAGRDRRPGRPRRSRGGRRLRSDARQPGSAGRRRGAGGRRRALRRTDRRRTAERPVRDERPRFRRTRAMGHSRRRLSPGPRHR